MRTITKSTKSKYLSHREREKIPNETNSPTSLRSLSWNNTRSSHKISLDDEEILETGRKKGWREKKGIRE